MLVLMLMLMLMVMMLVMVMAAIRGAELVMLMMLVAVMSMIMIVMLVVVLFDRQEFRLDFQDTVEIEGVAAEHGVEFDGAFGGAVQFCVGVDAANPRLDLFQFGSA